MVTTPAQLKFSLYWLILMDSSHSDTDLKGDPSEPLVLGRRMDTLREHRGDRKKDNNHQIFPQQRRGGEDCNYSAGSQGAIKKKPVGRQIIKIRHLLVRSHTPLLLNGRVKK